MKHSVDLFGHVIPAPEELPRDKQLTDESELIGHTIRQVFSMNCCKNDQMVILTETGCWLILTGYDDEGDESVTVETNKLELLDVVYPQWLLKSGIVPQSHREAFERETKRKQIAEMRADAAKCRSQADASIRLAERKAREADELEATLKPADGSAA